MKPQDNEQTPNKNKKIQISPTLPVNGCLWAIILAALACMSVKGCKMVNMKYEEAKVKHEMYMDSINKVRNDVLNYKGK